MKLRYEVVWYFLASLLLISGGATALTPAVASFPVVLNFEKNSSIVSAEERDKIIAAIKRIKAEDWCPFVQGIVNGGASKSEGTEAEQEALARLRAEHVGHILVEAGLPKQRTYLLVQKSLTPLVPGAEGQTGLRFDGFPGQPKCSIPQDANGFRVNP